MYPQLYEIYNNFKESLSTYLSLQLNLLNGSELIYDSIYSFVENSANDTYSNMFEILLLIVSVFHARPKQSQNIMNLLVRMTDKIANFFSSDDLIKIFSTCRRLVVFLYENKCINIESIKKEFLMYDDRFLLFYPEIRESDAEKFNKSMIIIWLSKFVKSIENTMTIEKYKEKRRIGHDDSTVANLIRNDDIEEFQIFISKTNFDLNSQIPSSVFESNIILNQNTTLIEYSAFFGSIKIFKFLLLQLEQINFFDEEKIKKLFKYSIVGGSSEIIHMVEGINSNLNIVDKQCIKQAIAYHQNKIAEYLIEKIDSSFSFDDLIFCIEKSNYEMFLNIIEDDAFTDIIEKGLKDPSIIEIQELLLFSLHVGNLTFFKLFLEIFKFDVNMLLSISFRFAYLFIYFQSDFFYGIQYLFRLFVSSSCCC